MSAPELVSAEEARELLGGMSSGEYPLADELSADEPDWNWLASRQPSVALFVASLRLARTVVALRAIIEGRTTAPTRAEIAAHEAAGGRWLVRNPELVRGYVETSAEYTADACRERGITLRWIALDADDRPCAWPEVSR